MRETLTSGASWTNTYKYRYEHESGGWRYCDTIRDAKESVVIDGSGTTLRPLERRTRIGWEHYGQIYRSSGGSVQWLKP